YGDITGERRATFVLRSASVQRACNGAARGCGERHGDAGDRVGHREAGEKRGVAIAKGAEAWDGDTNRVKPFHWLEHLREKRCL
ncbi:MAG: hypothetical protein SGPRY_014450, partial [Prymnesium sp.]